jgi:hypothetical protein
LECGDGRVMFRVYRLGRSYDRSTAFTSAGELLYWGNDALKAWAFVLRWANHAAMPASFAKHHEEQLDNLRVVFLER